MKRTLLFQWNLLKRKYYRQNLLKRKYYRQNLLKRKYYSKKIMMIYFLLIIEDMCMCIYPTHHILCEGSDIKSSSKWSTALNSEFFFSYTKLHSKSQESAQLFIHSCVGDNRCLLTFTRALEPKEMQTDISWICALIVKSIVFGNNPYTTGFFSLG